MTPGRTKQVPYALLSRLGQLDRTAAAMRQRNRRVIAIRRAAARAKRDEKGRFA
jgi:hypothetical protein